MLSQHSSLLHTAPSFISNNFERHPQYRLAKTLCAQIPLFCASNLFIVLFFGISTMMFLSQASLSSLFCHWYLISEAFLIFCKALHGIDLTISAEMPSVPTAFPPEKNALLCTRTDIVNFGPWLSPFFSLLFLAFSSHSSSSSFAFFLISSSWYFFLEYRSSSSFHFCLSLVVPPSLSQYSEWPMFCLHVSFLCFCKILLALYFLLCLNRFLLAFLVPRPPLLSRSSLL